MRHTTSSTENFRGTLALVALVYTAFVIYGSLVPLDFKALPWDTAVARFVAIPFLELGVDSRADWVANLLLFIPLTFFWMGALLAKRGLTAHVVMTPLLALTAIVLSVGIEFTQLYFPQRTVSQNDILAEAVGASIGIFAWWLAGEHYVNWLQAAKLIRTRAAFTDRLAWIFLAGLFVYNILPLDLTMSVVEIFHKWQAGKINLMPFARLPGDPVYALYEVVSDVLIWAPLAMLWAFSGNRSIGRVWSMTMTIVVVLEVMQLFVFSRVSDVSDLFTGALGAALGSYAGGRFAAHKPSNKLPWSGGRWMPFLWAGVWGALLFLVFWFPFDFRAEGGFIKDRLNFIYRMPFEVYYYGNEFRAATEVLHKLIFFAPLGALLAWGVRLQPWHWRARLFALAMLILITMPAVIELGQVMLPQKIADTTDWFLASAGGMLGYFLTERFSRKWLFIDQLNKAQMARPHR